MTLFYIIVTLTFSFDADMVFDTEIFPQQYFHRYTFVIFSQEHTHAHTHARTHSRTHPRAHTHTHTHTHTSGKFALYFRRPIDLSGSQEVLKKLNKTLVKELKFKEVKKLEPFQSASLLKSVLTTP